MDPKDLLNRFTYHPPIGLGQADKYEDLRHMALEVSRVIDQLCPDSREKSLAIKHLEEVVMWANAAIARHTPRKGKIDDQEGRSGDGKEDLAGGDPGAGGAEPDRGVEGV